MTDDPRALARTRPKARPRFAVRVRVGDVWHATSGAFRILEVDKDAPPSTACPRGAVALTYAAYYPTGQPYRAVIRHEPMRQLLVWTPDAVIQDEVCRFCSGEGCVLCET